jgi:hypothetical protein
MQPGAYYDPNSESTSDEQAVAAHWECLRRNAKFQETAKLWVRSESFRRDHALSPDYRHAKIHFQRCALDWMLRPSERLDLATFQISQGSRFKDGRFNFGPIVAKLQIPKALVTARNFSDAFQVGAQAETGVLRLEDNWQQAPQPFKEQFRVAIIDRRELRDITQFIGNGAMLTRLIAKYVAAGDPHNEKLTLADRLMVFGDELYDLGEFYALFAFPRNATFSRLKAMFSHVKKVLDKSGQLTQTRRYNLHRSFYGTREDWHWFLEAEARHLDPGKTSDLYKLADVYSEHLRRTAPGQRRKNVKTGGFRGTKVEGRLLRNRRATVLRHIQNIQGWIDRSYPPPPPSK